MAFYNRLKELRRSKGLTQAELSKITGLGQSTIAMYESHKREPNFDVLTQLADFFNVTTDYLLGKVSTPTAKKSDLGDVEQIDGSRMPPQAKAKSTDLLDFLFHDDPDFLAKIRSIDVKGKINEPGMILKLNEQQKSRLKDIIRLTVKEAEMNTKTHTAKVTIKKG